MTDSILDIDELLDKARYMLTEHKRLLPVLLVETSKGVYVIGMNVDFDKVDKRSMMRDIGSEFSKKKEKVEHLYMISAANVATCKADKCDMDIVDIENLKNFDMYEAIVIASFDVKNNKRDITIQKFETSNDDVVFKDVYKDKDTKGLFLLDAFMQGYYQSNITLN